MKKRRLPAAACLLLGCHPVFALQVDDPIVITASRTAETVDESLAPVTVITREAIERLQAQSVQDLLRALPGVGVVNNGGPGKTTSVFLRGTESDHVLVLIDGVRVGSATLGTTAFQDIPVDQIDRIEIVRGPRTSLYGSEAIGGVIQIFTRKGGGALRPFFALGGGSYRTYSASSGLSGGGTRGWFNLSVGGLDTAGFNACIGKPSPGGAGCFTIEPDRDGYRNLSGALRAGYRFGEGLEVDVHALRAEGKNAFDGGFVNESESVRQVLGGTLRYAPAHRWRVTLTAGRSRDASDNFKDGAFQSRFESERDTLSLQNDIALFDDQRLTVGVDYRDDRVAGTTAYAVTSRDDTGLFAQYRGGFDAHDVQFSLRRDDDAQFGARTTGAVAWGYALAPELRLVASYGTAFKAPTFNESYYPGYGNPALRPESSRSVEMGLRGEFGRGRWSVNAFETRIDDLIAYDASIFAPNNIDQARILGVEAVLAVRLGGWTWDAGLTLLDPKNRSGGANDGNLLPRRAERTLRVDADRDFGRYRLGATLVAVGRRYDDLANTRVLDGYATVDVRGEYHFARNWRLQGRIENLFDADYETAAYYNQPGRSAYLTLRYAP